MIAWAVLIGGVASARPLTDRLRWLVPPALRAIEYGALLWIGAVAGRRRAARDLRAAVRDHLPPLRGRLRPAPPRRHARRAGCAPLAGGWDGRLVLAVVLLVAGALPAGVLVLAGLLAVLFVGETVAEWRRFHAGEQPVYDDEEDEAD